MEISGKSQEALQVVVANLRSSQIQIDSVSAGTKNTQT